MIIYQSCLRKTTLQTMSNGKRKLCDDDSFDQSLPLPIQNFLWRQTNFFLNPKNRQTCEASCVTYERVLVQNILHGLSPSLCDSLSSISRWRLVKAALPHVMLCTAAMLSHRVEDKTLQTSKFDHSETKLLYTMHWLLLDAASECEDQDTEMAEALKRTSGNRNVDGAVDGVVGPVEKSGRSKALRKDGGLYLHELTSIQLFVYLMAPLVMHLQEGLFRTLKLENGLRIWQAMWDFRQPDVPCFAMPVKPQRQYVRAQRKLAKENTNTAEIYLGGGEAPPTAGLPIPEEGLGLFVPAPGEPSSPSQLADEGDTDSLLPESIAPLARLSDICPLSTLSGETGAATVSLEIVCEVCHSIVYNRCGDYVGCRCAPGMNKRDSWTFVDPRIKRLVCPVDKDWIKRRVEAACVPPQRNPAHPDVLSASHFDLAVLRCLFCPHWSEGGVYWAIKYIHQRMLEITHELSRSHENRRPRSRSLPVFPSAQMMTFSSADNSPSSVVEFEVGAPSDARHPLSSPSCPSAPSSSSPSHQSSPYAARPSKKLKVMDLKEKFSRISKLKRIESTDHDDEDCLQAAYDGTAPPGRIEEGSELDPDYGLSPGDPDSDERRKSLPNAGGKVRSHTVKHKTTLSAVDGAAASAGSGDLLSPDSAAGKLPPRAMSFRLLPERAAKPIIRVTEVATDCESPLMSSEDHLRSSGGSDSMGSLQGAAGGANSPEAGPNFLHRCLSDFAVKYTAEDQLEEVAGSVHYIQANGHLNYQVVLKAIYWAVKYHPSPQICEVVMNILFCLIDLDIFEKKEAKSKKNVKETTREKFERVMGTKDESATNHGPPPMSVEYGGGDCIENKQPLTSHGIAMDILMRVIRAVGCSHGCTDSYHNDTITDLVRSQIHACLLRLHRLHPVMFREHLEHMVATQCLSDLVDLLHSFTGFCMDPAAHMSPKPGLKTDAKTGYRNNFGQSFNGEGTRGSEGIVISNLLKPLVRRLTQCRKELNGAENIALYADIRQFLSYLKEVHGSTFRRTMLQCLLDGVKRRKRKKEVEPSAGKQHNSSFASEPEEPARASSFSTPREYHQQKYKKSLFKKRSNHQLKRGSTPVSSFASDSEVLEEGGNRRPLVLSISPRSSMSEKEGEDSSQPATPKRMFHGKFNIGRRSKGARSDGEEDSEGGVPPGADISPVSAKAANNVNANSGKRKGMSFKVAGQATLSFLSARRRLEEGLKSKKAKREHVDDAAVDIMSLSKASEISVKHGSDEGCASVGSESARKPRERRPVDILAVKDGLLQFTFLLESAQPGSIPEPQLIAALLDLEAPVVSRACLLLECANFVHRCNKGEWPQWLKMAIPGSFRHSSYGNTGGSLHPRNFPSTGGGFGPMSGGGHRRNVYAQRLAGRLFHAWAEALGSRVEYFLRVEQAADRFASITTIHDERKQRELQQQDREEDFLDDSTVNENGESCPYALKAVAVHLLLEITTYLRETHQYLPKARGPSFRKETVVWERQGTKARKASQPFSSHGSDHSPGGSLAGSPTTELPGDVNPHSVANRRISFAVFPDRSSSVHSSSTSLDNIEAGGEGLLERRMKRVQGRKLLKMRRGSGSFKRGSQPSIRQKREPSSIKAHRGSIRTRKISAQSQASINLNDGNDTAEPSPSGPSDGDTAPDSPLPGDAAHGAAQAATPTATGPLKDGATASGGTTGNTTTAGGTQPCDHRVQVDTSASYMPWVKVVTQFANRTNFVCEHVGFCHPNCYERQQRQCRRLLTAVNRIYSADEDDNIMDDIDAAEFPFGQRMISENDEKKLSLFTKGSLVGGIGISGASISGGSGVAGGVGRRKESMYPGTSSVLSAARRRESTPLLEKLKPESLPNAKLRHKGNEKERAQKTDPSKKKQQEHPMIRYLCCHVYNLTHTCFSIVNKSALLLNSDHFSDIMPVAWELLLESDQELVGSAAVVILLSAIKVPALVHELMIKELQHEDVNQRMNAVLRFRALWFFRFQFWARLEENASSQLKIPPPNIEFVLPSPTLGLPSVSVADPPWMPRFKTSVEEVQLKQDEAAKTFMTASTTRRKQQEELMEKTLSAEEQRRKIARENFHLTTVSIQHMAVYEPGLFHSGEEHEEAPPPPAPVQEEFNAAVRRLSVAPLNRTLNAQSRHLSWRHGSIPWFRFPPHEDEEGMVTGLPVPSQPLQQAQSVFPSSICSAVVNIIHLLDDVEVNSDGVSVCTIAEHVIWLCLVEDSTLFLRYFLEKLTRIQNKEELICVLRKLIMRLPEIPAQTAHTLFNYILGYIMFCVRTPNETAQESIAGALSILWLVVPSVQGIFFKDLKQTLRKEQCDPTLMVTANIPSAKKIVVHGPDLSSIPSQLPVHEDTRFSTILEDCLDFFNIPDDEKDQFFLCDTKSHQMHNLLHYVRDFYFFKRNHYPQLSLVKKEPTSAFRQLQQQSFMLKFTEIGKVLFSHSILQHTPYAQVPTHVYFLYEELSKLPAFPRKALEVEFSLYQGESGRELQGLDLLHKYVWTRFIRLFFEKNNSSFPWGTDISLFLNVINGTLVLHAEDSAMLRYCMASYIQCCRHFKTIFALNGYVWIMPTLFRIYNLNRGNETIMKAIQFGCKQFYVLHRTPFILQMFGSIANLIDIDCPDDGPTEFSKITPRTLYSILSAMASNVEDKLDILGLVRGKKPLKALDFCYEDDSDSPSLLEAVNLCVTVISYAPESYRAKQMMIILQAILPYILRDLPSVAPPTDSNVDQRKSEVHVIQQLSTSMKQLINATDSFMRQTAAFQRTLDVEKASFRATAANHSQGAFSALLDDKDDSPYRRVEEGRGRKEGGASEEERQQRAAFVEPREALLKVACEFLTKCTVRLQELRREASEPSRVHDLLDPKSHLRLAEIAHSLLKMVPTDASMLQCQALLQFIQEVMPIIDWSQDAVRPALHLLLRRLDRTFSKLSKKPMFRGSGGGSLRMHGTRTQRHMNWDGAASLLKGVYCTLQKNKFVAHLPHTKSLVNVCLNLILSDSGGLALNESISSVQFIGKHEPASPSHTHGGSSHAAVPPKFHAAVIKLVALQMQALGDLFSLEQVCNGTSIFQGNDKTTSILLNLIVPLLMRCGTGKPDSPIFTCANINFALSCILHALYPPPYRPTGAGGGPALGPSAVVQSTVGGGMSGGPACGPGAPIKPHQHLSVSDLPRSGSVTQSERSFRITSDMVYRLGFLGLKIILVCYARHAYVNARRIVKTIGELGSKRQGGIHLWKFLDFIVTNRPALFVQLYPFIRFKMSMLRCDSQGEAALQQIISQKLSGCHLPQPRSGAALLREFALELRNVREELQGTGVAGSSTAAAELAAGPGGRVRLDTWTTESLPSSHSASVPAPRGLSRPHGVGAGALLPGSAGLSLRASFRRNSSKRIFAREGSKILDKYSMGRPEGGAIAVPSVDSLQSNTTIEESDEVAESSYHRLQRGDVKGRKTMKFRTKIGGSMRARAPVIRHRSVDSFTTETSSGVSPQGLADDESSSTASLIRSNTMGHARKYIQRSRSEERDDLTHQGTVKGRLKARQQMAAAAAAGGFGPRNNSRRSGEVGEEGPYTQTDNELVVALAESESSVTSPSEHSALIRHPNNA